MLDTVLKAKMLLGPYPELFDQFCLFIPAQLRSQTLQQAETMERSYPALASFQPVLAYLKEFRVRCWVVPS